MVEGFLLALPEVQRPTAVRCLSDQIAIGALNGAQSLGFEVGQDVAITGFDDVSMAEFLHPALTTVRQPIPEVGRQVVERLTIVDRPAVIADGGSVQRAKPAPDLFRYAAAMLDAPPDQCLVVEDAAAGIAAAISAAIPALALGPAERFGEMLAQRSSWRRPASGGTAPSWKKQTARAATTSAT